jgi:hypothetical protein
MHANKRETKRRSQLIVLCLHLATLHTPGPGFSSRVLAGWSLSLSLFAQWHGIISTLIISTRGQGRRNGEQGGHRRRPHPPRGLLVPLQSPLLQLHPPRLRRQRPRGRGPLRRRRLRQREVPALPVRGGGGGGAAGGSEAGGAESARDAAEAFDAVSGVRRAYAALQGAHCPWDPAKMRSADAAVVAELRHLARLRDRFRRSAAAAGRVPTVRPRRSGRPRRRTRPRSTTSGASSTRSRPRSTGSRRGSPPPPPATLPPPPSRTAAPRRRTCSCAAPSRPARRRGRSRGGSSTGCARRGWTSRRPRGPSPGSRSPPPPRRASRSARWRRTRRASSSAGSSTSRSTSTGPSPRCSTPPRSGGSGTRSSRTCAGWSPPSCSACSPPAPSADTPPASSPPCCPRAWRRPSSGTGSTARRCARPRPRGCCTCWRSRSTRRPASSRPDAAPSSTWRA